MREGRMTLAQERFCAEYIRNGGIGGAAYRYAYPRTTSDNSARACASALLANPKVQAYIDKLKRESNTADVMSIAEIKEWLTKCIKDDAICGGKRTLNRDRLKAIDMLIRMSGGYIDRQEIDITGAIPVVMADDVRE